MSTHPRHTRLPGKLKADLVELAYQQRSTASAIIREVVTDYGSKGLAGVELADPGMITPGSMEQVHFLVEPEVWETASARAKRESVTLPEVIRRALAHKVQALVPLK